MPFWKKKYDPLPPPPRSTLPLRKGEPPPRPFAQSGRKMRPPPILPPRRPPTPPPPRSPPYGPHPKRLRAPHVPVPKYNEANSVFKITPGPNRSRTFGHSVLTGECLMQEEERDIYKESIFGADLMEEKDYWNKNVPHDELHNEWQSHRNQSGAASSRPPRSSSGASGSRMPSARGSQFSDAPSSRFPDWSQCSGTTRSRTRTSGVSGRGYQPRMLSHSHYSYYSGRTDSLSSSSQRYDNSSYGGSTRRPSPHAESYRKRSSKYGSSRR